MLDRRSLLPVLALPIALAACARAPRTAASSSMSSTGDARVDTDLERLRAATRPFRVLDSAVAAGYARDVSDCLVHEHHGAMGYHHANRGYLSRTLDVAKPQILLYERRPDGAYRLNGVEFIVPYRLYARDSAPPVLFGRQLMREDNLAIWYLHVWAWTPNPDGVFANFHPEVRCPDGASKVFRPFTRDGAAP
jgi:hypothetical protein